MTPKAFAHLNVATLPEKYRDVEFVPSVELYLNMSDGWTKEECDNTAYIVEIDDMNEMLLKMEYFLP